MSIRYLTVTELTKALGSALERTFPNVFFEGEVCGITRAASGHLYFTVKDATSQIASVMWKSSAMSLDFPLKEGTQVLCQGRPSLYSVTGKLQMSVQRMTQSGEGALRRKLMELQEKLLKEGLFSPERKRRLPFLPRAVGVVTSGSGAVIHDIMVKLQERMPVLPVYLVDVRVQGEGAAREIAEGIEILNARGLVDVIIVARGGGSLQDLWAFNEEVVVRAIFASAIPVVSGVGHEVDISLSDLVADVRAPTPTAAAELVSPRRDELLRRIAELEGRLANFEQWFLPREQRVDELEKLLEARITKRLADASIQVAGMRYRLSSLQPGRVIAGYIGRVELLRERLLGAGQRDVSRLRRTVEVQESNLRSSFSKQNLSRMRDTVQHLEKRLSGAAANFLRREAADVRGLSLRLESVSPQRVLERGYAIVYSEGKVVKKVAELTEGTHLNLTFADGKAEATTTRIRNER